MPDRLLTDKKFRALFWSFIVVMGASILGLIVAMIYVITEIQEQAEVNGNLSQAVLDCVDKNGECYKDGAARTGAAVGNINTTTFRVIVAALSCEADGIRTERALADCIAERAPKVVIPE